MKRTQWLKIQSRFYKYLLLLVSIVLIGLISGCKIFRRHTIPDEDMPVKYGAPPMFFQPTEIKDTLK